MIKITITEENLHGADFQPMSHKLGFGENTPGKSFSHVGFWWPARFRVRTSATIIMTLQGQAVLDIKDPRIDID